MVALDSRPRNNGMVSNGRKVAFGSRPRNNGGKVFNGTKVALGSRPRNNGGKEVIAGAHVSAHNAASGRQQTFSHATILYVRWCNSYRTQNIWGIEVIDVVLYVTLRRFIFSVHFARRPPKHHAHGILLFFFYSEVIFMIFMYLRNKYQLNI